MVKVRVDDSIVACRLSNEVQALDIGAKVRMRDRDRSQVSTFGTVTDQVS